MNRTKAFILAMAGLAVVITMLIILAPEKRQIAQEKKAVVAAAKVRVSGKMLPRYRALAASAEDPAIGKHAPALAGRNTLDENMLVAPGEDPPTLIVFVSHWCDQCTEQIKTIVDWSSERDEPDGVRVIAIVTASDKAQENWPPSRWLAENKWPFDVLYDDVDGEARRAYGVSGLPHFVLVGTDGLVLRRVEGLLSDSDLDLIVEQALESATAPDTDTEEPDEQVTPGEVTPAPADDAPTADAPDDGAAPPVAGK